MYLVHQDKLKITYRIFYDRVHDIDVRETVFSGQTSMKSKEGKVEIDNPSTGVLAADKDYVFALAKPSSIRYGDDISKFKPEVFIRNYFLIEDVGSKTDTKKVVLKSMLKGDFTLLLLLGSPIQ